MPPVDALLFLSFGGPEGPDDVMPFLRRVTQGKNIPDERLAEVSEHYFHFGGISPLNALNREIITHIEHELDSSGWNIPVYFGNRNWYPLLEDTVQSMAADGIRRALVFVTSAWGGYSGEDQYLEDLNRAREAVGNTAPLLEKLPPFWDHPLFIDTFADAVREARSQLESHDEPYRLVFTAHSVPLQSGGREIYEQQVHSASALVAKSVGESSFDVVWQSRSGPPAVPWLEPDICDHLELLAEQGVKQVVICPVGFVSDHIEVVWDLDNEAREKCDSLQIELVRAKTPGPDVRFAQLAIALAHNALSS